MYTYIYLKVACLTKCYDITNAYNWPYFTVLGALVQLVIWPHNDIIKQ